MNAIGLHEAPSAMEPLLPEASRAQLSDLTCEILREAGRLSAHVPSEITRGRIASLVREMNSYYSNSIEGHKTLPRDIEKALKADYSTNKIKRENQRLARAHIEVEAAMEARLQAEPELSIHSAEFLSWIHREFYQRLPEEMHFSKDRSGNSYRIEPGSLRTFEVLVGRHAPPHYGALSEFLSKFAAFYGSNRILPTNQLLALAAAHHRLAWIHPFGDGNGRVIRLYSHAWFIRCRVDSCGLWTLSRGLARQRAEYYQRLANADQGRWNDVDGRGNLSDRFLAEFCVFLLRTALDQIVFMSGLLQLDHLCTRIDRYLQIEALHIVKGRERLARLLKAALLEGEIERGRVPEIVGMSASSARETIRLGLKEGLLDSPTPKGHLSIVFSSKTLETYFPQLFQNLPMEERS